MELAVFVVLWVVTFLPAWWLLLRLMAWSASDMTQAQKFQFTGTFVIYRLVIAAPYIYLVWVGQDQLPVFVQSFVLGFVVFGFLLSMMRFFCKDRLSTWLWNIYALAYDGLIDFYPYSLLQQKMLKYANPKNDEIVLDLGCGTGNLTIMLKNKNPSLRIKAVDSSQQMLRVLHKKLQIDSDVYVTQADLMDYLRTTPDNTFNLVTLANVLYTVQDRTEFWNQLLRVLSPGGRAIITNSDRSGSWPLIREHVHNKNFMSLLRPRLVAVFIIDAFISELSKTGTFSFVSFEDLVGEIEGAGGKSEYYERCYGGEKDGVNILFAVFK